MILSILRGGRIGKEELIMVLLTFPIVLISLVIHELSHGLMAKKLGDPTAKYMGRLTLNPLSHLDPIGTVSMLLFGIGWAKPVPIDPRYFKNPKKGMALVGLAGPLSNLIIALIGVLSFRILSAFGDINIWLENGMLYSYRGLIFGGMEYAGWFFYRLASLNVYLALFNLIPVPPFDGSRIFYAFLPTKYYFGVMRYERYIMMITMVLLATGIVTLPLDFLTAKVIWLFDFIFGLVPGL
ncbi:MAG: site-2 protease family protein [Ruminococcaceae bacterium]|nr:site-2 protease family protein [Oscillospiraceae bacterium]